MRLITALLLVLLPSATSALSREGGGQARSPKGTATGWDERLRQIDKLLVQGDSAAAYSEVSDLLTTMTDEIVSGTGTAEFLGVATVLRAIAAVQLGRAEEGVWHWLVAQQLFPAVASYQMSAYGEVGTFLKRYVPRGEQRQPEGVRWFMPPIEPPVKLEAPVPDFPRGKRLSGRGGDSVKIFVNTIIGKDGRVSDPVITTTSGDPVLLCATLDKLREWRYKPATMNGEPVAVFFTLTVNFELQKRRRSS